MIPILPACVCCKRLDRSTIEAFPALKCKAFPEGVPEPIARARVEHLKPYPGDHDLQFEQDPDKPDAYPA